MKGKISQKIFLSLILLGIMITTALAVPSGPKTLDVTDDEKLQAYSTINKPALAGNVTELIFDVWSVTRTWQGYYGNISGTIVLADQNNNTLYDWKNTNPNGRIYATRNPTTTWTDIRCATDAELDYEGEFAGIVADRNGVFSVDTPNLTFSNSTTYGTGADAYGNNNVTGIWANYSDFWVGPVQINGTADSANGECFSAVMHNNNTWDINNQNAQNDQNHWREVLLSDDTANGTIYTAILEVNDEVGFDNRPHDFEMIVPEDGHGINVVTTTYYFYVELE